MPVSTNSPGNSSSTASSDDSELVELEERTEIVEKYDKGEENQEAEEWENPNFEVYTKVDRYGFLRDDIPASACLIEEKVKMTELKRESKWLRMVQKWEIYRNSAKLRQRIVKGIPEKFRSVIWAYLLDVDKFRRAGVYSELCIRARLMSKDLKQIDLDINRTYRNHLFFRRRYDAKQKDLFHILAAYALYNPHVGYCQGMSQIAALLLMYFEEEDAFWALHSLMCNEKYSMHGFFAPGFPKLLRFQRHHDRIMQKKLPKLKKHMDKHDLYTDLYTTKWFLQCFLDRVPFTLALRLWDYFILDGDVVLTAVAYCVLKIHQKKLLSMDFEKMMHLFQTWLEQDFAGAYNPDLVIQELRTCLLELKRDGLQSPRELASASENVSGCCGEILFEPFDIELARATSTMLLNRRGRGGMKSSRAPSMSKSTPAIPVASTSSVLSAMTTGSLKKQNQKTVTTIYVRPALNLPSSQRFNDNSAISIQDMRLRQHVRSIYDNVDSKSWNDDDNDSLVLETSHDRIKPLVVTTGRSSPPFPEPPPDYEINNDNFQIPSTSQHNFTTEPKPDYDLGVQNLDHTLSVVNDRLNGGCLNVDSNFVTRVLIDDVKHNLIRCWKEENFIYTQVVKQTDFQPVDLKSNSNVMYKPRCLLETANDMCYDEQYNSQPSSPFAVKNSVVSTLHR